MTSKSVEDGRDYFREEMRRTKQYGWLIDRPQFTTLLAEQLRQDGALRHVVPVGATAVAIEPQLPEVTFQSWMDLTRCSAGVRLVEEPDDKVLSTYHNWKMDDMYRPGPAEPYWIFALEGKDGSSTTKLHLLHRDAQSLGINWQYYWQEVTQSFWAVPVLMGANGVPLRRQWQGTATLGALDVARQREQFILERIGYGQAVPLTLSRQQLCLVNLVEGQQQWLATDLAAYFGLQVGGYRPQVEVVDWVDVDYQPHLLVYQPDLDQALCSLEMKRRQAMIQSIEVLD